MQHFVKKYSLTTSVLVFVLFSLFNPIKTLADHCDASAPLHCINSQNGVLTCVLSERICRLSAGTISNQPLSQVQTNTPQNPTQVQNPPTPIQTTSSGGGGTLVNPLRAKSIPELLGIILQGLVQIGSIILVLALVWVGFLFVVAQGKEEKIREARGALMWTVIGGLVLLGAQAIASLIQATVNALQP